MGTLDDLVVDDDEDETIDDALDDWDVAEVNDMVETEGERSSLLVSISNLRRFVRGFTSTSSDGGLNYS